MNDFTHTTTSGAQRSRLPAARAIIAVGIAALLVAACEQGGPVAPSSEGEIADFTLRYVSSPQVTPVTSVPQSRPYPGTKVAGEVAVCKDASSPAGSYQFEVSATNVSPGDLIASSVSLHPGRCSIVYNRLLRPGGSSPVTRVTIREVIPEGANYRLDRVFADDDAANGRTVPGPSVTLVANAWHGAYATFFNEPGSVVHPPTEPLIDLGGNETNGILAGTTVTCVTGSTVNADISVSPGTAITGFGPCVVTGVLNSGNAVAAQAQLDLTASFNLLMGMPCPPANVITADIGGTTKPAGVYCSASSIGVTGTVTLDGGGDPNSIFVFQAGSTLTAAGSVVLINGAQAKNVFWVVGSSATIGTSSQWQGNILAQASITLNDTVSLIGRALARDAAVTLGTGVVITLP